MEMISTLKLFSRIGRVILLRKDLPVVFRLGHNNKINENLLLSSGFKKVVDINLTGVFLTM